MNILLACQCSTLLLDLLREAGHNAWTCDLKASEGDSPFHMRSDVLKHLDRPWDCMIAMPECRYLCSSGQHRTGKLGQRTTQDVEDAAAFFMELAEAPIDHKCIENSIGIMSTIYRKPDQIIHPYQFGDDASKSTCLWLTDFPPLVPSFYAPPRMVCNGCFRTTDWEIDFGQYPPKPQPCELCHGKRLPRWANQTDAGHNKLAPSPTRSADRARTYPGIAKALADAVGRINVR